MKLKYKYLARLMACLFFISNLASGGILKDDVVSIGEESFSFQYVCKKALKKEVPLIVVKNILTLDCMTKEVKTYEFCFKELSHSPYYIRGVIDTKAKKVICKKAKKVTMKLTCDTAGVECDDPELACFKLQEKYASRLMLEHHSSFVEEKIKVLNCHFGAKKSLTLPKDI